MKSLDEVITTGLMAKHMKETGLRIKWMDKESCCGRMESAMKANLQMIKEKVMASSSGQMVASTSANGKEASSTVLGRTFLNKGSRKKVSGTMGVKFDGWMVTMTSMMMIR